MEFVIGIQIDTVIARANPIAIGVHQTNVESKKPKQLIDVANRLQLCRQFIHRSLINHAAEFDQLRQCLLPARFLFIGIPIVCGILTPIVQSTATPGRPGHFPTGALGGVVVLLNKLLVVLLNVREDTSVFAVDHDSNKIGFGRRHVLPSNLRIQDRTHQRSVTICVQQIECLVSKNPLLIVNHVHRHIERPFVAGRHVIVRRSTTKTDAAVRIGFSVDGQGCRNIHIRVVKIFKFLFPILTLKIDEYRPQDGGIVKRPFNRLHR